MSDKPFHVVGIEGADGSATVLGEYASSAEAREFLQRYTRRLDDDGKAGGWSRIEVLDTRDECAETLWRWEASEQEGE